MILRRFMQHVKEQNWFAVGLDVLVVIVGIFLGLQVQALYEEREEREQEQVYLNRLHDEVMQALNFTDENFDALLVVEDFQENARLLDEILNVFDGVDNQTTLGPRHCLAIMTSHIYNDQSTFPPTLSELTSSGQLPLITSENIKKALANFSLAFDALTGQVEAVSQTGLLIARKYPDLIKLDRQMKNLRKVDEINHECNFDAMQSHTGFNNDLVDNRSRQNAFILTLINQQKALEAVHIELDAELNYIH